MGMSVGRPLQSSEQVWGGGDAGAGEEMGSQAALALSLSGHLGLH